VTDSRERLFTAPFFAMCGYSFTVFLSLFQLLPTAPFHIHDLGGSRVQSGLFLGLLTYSCALFAPVTGALADRMGRTRQLLVCSLAIAGFSALYSAAPSVMLLLVVVPVHGIVWSGLLSASGAYMTSILPPGRRVRLQVWRERRTTSVEATVGENPPKTQHAYTVGDLSFGLTAEMWEASLYIDNVWDERGEVFFNNRWGRERLSINQPRMFGFTFKRRFN